MIYQGEITGPEQVPYGPGGSPMTLKYKAAFKDGPGRSGAINFWTNESAISALSTFTSEPEQLFKDLCRSYLAEELDVGDPPQDKVMDTGEILRIHEIRTAARSYLPQLLESARSVFEAAVTTRETAINNFLRTLGRDGVKTYEYEDIARELPGPAGVVLRQALPSMLQMYRQSLEEGRSQFNAYIAEQFGRVRQDFPEVWHEYLEMTSEE
jgi:hypothetical protein